MNWLRRIIGRPPIDEGLKARLLAWRQLPNFSPSTPIDQAGYVLVDVESTGLNPSRDSLLAIGAVPVGDGQLLAGEGFEKILWGEKSGPRDTILIHGITPTAVASGEPPQQVLMDFLEYAGKRPLVAYHASFDEAMLGRAYGYQLGMGLPHYWLDLAWIGPALFPELGFRRKPLDVWLDHFNLQAFIRHRALADCLVTGELMLIFMHRARKLGLRTVGDLMSLERMEKNNSQGGPGGI